jgi:hypothetical protein
MNHRRRSDALVQIGGRELQKSPPSALRAVTVKINGLFFAATFPMRFAISGGDAAKQLLRGQAPPRWRNHARQC